MRILVLHSPYLSGPASGENRVVEDEARLLREGGHEVTVFTPDRAEGRAGALREGLASVWSAEAVAQVLRLVDETHAEIVHCHNLFPALSPAVLRAAAEKAAVVMTLHNYRLACLPATFLRDDRICEDCLGRVPWRGVVHRCYRNSAAGSAALATSLTLHRALGSFRRVARFLAVSDFVRTKHVQAGMPSGRVTVKRNFAWPVQRSSGAGNYFLFAGRLSPEKGLSTLLEAWAVGDHRRLVIAGDGPEGEELRRLAPKSVEFLGAVDPQEMSTLVADARALIVPSVWYEGAPRSILEAYAAGVPVLASSIGALPEVVNDCVTGLLFPPKDARALAEAVEKLEDDGERTRLGEGAWKEWNDRYSPEVGLKGLEAAYRSALAEPAAR